MKTIEVIENAMAGLKPLIDILQLHVPDGRPDFEDTRITWRDDVVVVISQKQIFSMGWLDVKQFGKDDISLMHFEYHREGDEYFLNLSPDVTLFIPVIEIDKEDSIIAHQIVKLLPGQACIIPAGVIHAPPFQNQKVEGIMLVFKRHKLDLVPVITNMPLQFQMEV